MLRLGAKNPRDVHRLVLLAFLGPAPEGTEARHLNGDPADNRFENLVWDERRTNVSDRKWHEGCTRYKLSPDDVRHIRIMLNQSIPMRHIARLMEISRWTITDIISGRVHGDVV